MRAATASTRRQPSIRLWYSAVGRFLRLSSACSSASTPMKGVDTGAVLRVAMRCRFLVDQPWR